MVDVRGHHLSWDGRGMILCLLLVVFLVVVVVVVSAHFVSASFD